MIIFLLDSFNATVYSVGGKDISDATDEARQIRELYSGARIGGVVFLVVSAAGGCRRRRRAVPAAEKRAGGGR